MGCVSRLSESKRWQVGKYRSAAASNLGECRERTCVESVPAKIGNDKGEERMCMLRAKVIEIPRRCRARIESVYAQA